MSFEGYYQCMCKNGHYWTEELQYSYAEDELKDCKCYKCNEEVYWWNLVDTTNGSFEVSDVTGKEYRIDGYIELTIKRQKVCEHCNSILEVIYNIPTKGGYIR